MNCLAAHLVETRVGFINPRKMKSISTCTHLHYSSKSWISSIVMRDRSKNRKPLQKGRYLSIEAIQTIQALKRAAKHSESEVLLRQVFGNKFGRLLKFDMIAVLRELLHQNHCHLALKAFEDIRKEDWYKPKLFLYTEMVTALGSNGMLDKVEVLIMKLKVETTLDPDIEGFNSLLESLMTLNLTRLAIECFYLMKSLPCDPDRLSYKILITGLETNGEMDLLAVVQEEAKKDYGNFLDFSEDKETVKSTFLLCQLREQVLREVGFKDIFKKIKDEENAKAISLFQEVVRLSDSIEDEPKRVENLIRGIFAGNIFDLGSAQLAELFAKDGMSFQASCQNLLPRPWVIDDLDNFISKWSRKSWKKVVIFVDNSGADIILGILPFARELLRIGVQVVLAANDLPSINDITYPELIEIIGKLKDDKGKLLGVDTSNLLIANSGNDLPVIDLTRVSQELAYLATDADLVVMEGMGRGIETNLYAQFKCDSLKVAMVKHVEVAQFLGGRLYDCVIKFNEFLG